MIQLSTPGASLGLPAVLTAGNALYTDPVPAGGVSAALFVSGPAVHQKVCCWTVSM